MKLLLFLRTLRRLKLMQVCYQVKLRLVKPVYVALQAPIDSFNFQVSRLKTDPIPKYKSVEGEKFSFLNLVHEFADWNFTENGMLWAYNQNYFDWINQIEYTEKDGCKWIDKFIKELTDNKVGLDPYPIALRSINWVKFFCRYPNAATKPRLDSLYSQIRLLEKKLEYHLLGNHLLEDAYALYIGSFFFNDKPLLLKAKKLLLSQLDEQVLKDGAHYEQSPMYQCVLIDRLLDCINVVSSFKIQDSSQELENLSNFAVRMLGHLESIVWSDGTIPMFNDCANSIAPTPKQLFDYAKGLGLTWEPVRLKECGYRKLTFEGLEAIVDVGSITASYQPGHSHADTLSYELRINGRPVIVDTGISTYNLTERRQYERSTPAHNCVCVDGKDSSEVWGGFRVGKRCKTQIIKDEKFHVVASHNGYDKPCVREFQIKQHEFIIIDRYKGEAVSYIHLAPGISPDIVHIEHAGKMDVCDDMVSDEYNSFKETKCLKINFKDYCKYRILTN